MTSLFILLALYISSRGATSAKLILLYATLVTDNNNNNNNNTSMTGYVLLTGFGFLTFELEDSVDLVVNEHFIQIGGKQVVTSFLPRDALVHSAVLRLLSSVCLSVCVCL